jgi:Conjugative transposon protein TcpC
MVRRAILDRGEEQTADDEALPPSQPITAKSGRPAAHWRGAGGRWMIWVARTVAWCVLLLIGYRGVLAIVQGQGSGASGSSAAAVGGTRFPVSLAEAYALDFGDVYFNYSPATAAKRAHDLARFLPRGASSQLGWNGAGTQVLLSDQVAGVQVSSDHAAVVTLLAAVGNGNLVELGVPIYAGDGGMAVSGDPALLAAPAQASPPLASQQAGDPATETELQSQLPAFFEAYASGDRATLARFVVPGSAIASLGGAVTFSAIDNVYAPAGGARRQISVTVTWQLPTYPAAKTVATAPAALQMTYQMTVVRLGNSWNVASIGASADPQQSSPVQGPP